VKSGGWYASGGKRMLDLAIALAGLIVLSPVILVIAVLVRVAIGSPVLFRQQRPGRLGEPFTLLKFRTMSETKEPSGALLDDAARLTALGRLLRSLSLDELPELWNVIAGEMSLVGPRPLLMDYLPLYSPEQSRRHEIRPGITGWAQVNGRNSLSWERRFDLDVWYVDHLSLRLDLSIMLKTLVSAVRREGIAADGHVTMPRFTGKES
jgi:lipopolysaccharide/colanic/teichoic acid biosynthesis glycosyltransferase